MTHKNCTSTANEDGIRQSLLSAGNPSRSSATVDLPIQRQEYDLNSRKLCRYLIEDAIFVNMSEEILILICEDSIVLYSGKN